MCDVCRVTAATGSVGKMMNDVCEPCGLKMASCKHNEGERYEDFDADSCCYLVWRCKECSFCTVDDMP